MNRYFDVVLNIMSYSIQHDAVFIPFLIVLSFWIVIGVVFLIRYIVRSN